MSQERTRYLSSQPSGFVFNLDRQRDDRQFVIVVEGPIDAIGIDGCAVLGSSICDIQTKLINSLNKEVIVVPDQDKGGGELIETAIKNGWSVSIPSWKAGIKDVNDSVIEYGRLATLWMILEEKETSELKIRLREKTWSKQKRNEA